MYKVLRPVDTNDATRGFWPRYQEPGPPTFLQGVRTLLGPLALLLRPPGIATNLQSLNAEKEAGGHSSFHQSVANEATDDWRGYEPGTPGSRTCFSFSTVDKLSTLVFLVPWSFTILSPKPFLPQQRRSVSRLVIAVKGNSLC